MNENTSCNAAQSPALQIEVERLIRINTQTDQVITEIENKMQQLIVIEGAMDKLPNKPDPFVVNSAITALTEKVNIYEQLSVRIEYILKHLSKII
jgi:hypothetical protein